MALKWIAKDNINVDKAIQTLIVALKDTSWEVEEERQYRFLVSEIRKYLFI